MHLQSEHNRDIEDVQSDAMGHVLYCVMSCLLSLFDTDLCTIFVNNFSNWSTYHSNYTQIKGKVVSGV